MMLMGNGIEPHANKSKSVLHFPSSGNSNRNVSHLKGFSPVEVNLKAINSMTTDARHEKAGIILWV